MGYKVAVVGATGNVGGEMLNTLSEREFPIDKIYAVASSRSVGQEVSFGENDVLPVEDLDGFDFSKVDIVLASVGAKVTEEFTPRATKAGAIVIDNSSVFRMDEGVPLVVPEVNPKEIANYKNKNIIANPNCSTIQMLVALKPLHDAAKIKRIVVSTYQSVSGAGRPAMDELFNQTKATFMNSAPKKEHFSKPIAFNVIPQIDYIMDDGDSKEEWKMVVETQKILDPDIKVTATCVRVPVFLGHAEAINIEFENKITPAKARDILRKAEGVIVLDRPDEDGGFLTPIEVVGDDSVYVSRIREDKSLEHGLNIWVVADNLRKGAALNAVQIAEILVKDYI